MEAIPLVDLSIQQRAIAEDARSRLQAVLDRTAFILGPEVDAFEEAFAGYSGVSHCIGVANGTDALELALRGSGVTSDDEVIIPANTFIATAAAVVRAGARPVLVDSDHDTHLIDVARVAEAAGARTRAVMPVHLYGQLAAMEELFEVASRRELLVVEDAAQAQGASRHGTRAGGFGIAAGTSFYPGKNLGAYGDAGAVLTNDDDLANHVRALRNHGSPVKYEHPELGFNSRLDTLQAVVLSLKLQHLDEWNAQRRSAAARYDALLADVDEVRLPVHACRQRARVAPLRRARPRRDEVLSPPAGRWHRCRHPLPHPDPPARRVPPPRAPRRGLSGRRGARRRRSSRCPSTRASPRRSRTGSPRPWRRRWHE